MARYVWASTSAKPSLGSGCESCEGLSTDRNLSLRTPDPLDNNLQRADQQASKRCDPHNPGEKLSPTLKLATRKRLAQGVPHHRQPAWPRGLTSPAAREQPPRSLCTRIHCDRSPWLWSQIGVASSTNLRKPSLYMVSTTRYRLPFRRLNSLSRRCRQRLSLIDTLSAKA
jgi:hypothetical protein